MSRRSREERHDHREKRRLPDLRRRPDAGRQRGFTLVELLVAMAITTIILGTTMMAMNDAIKATDSAAQISDLNNGLRTAMDMMVRDALQVGQGLPTGRTIGLPYGNSSSPMQLPGPHRLELSARRPVVLPARSQRRDP